MDGAAELAAMAGNHAAPDVEEHLGDGRVRRRFTGGIEELKNVLRMKVG